MFVYFELPVKSNQNVAIEAVRLFLFKILLILISRHFIVILFCTLWWIVLFPCSTFWHVFMWLWWFCECIYELLGINLRQFYFSHHMKCMWANCVMCHRSSSRAHNTLVAVFSGANMLYCFVVQPAWKLTFVLIWSWVMFSTVLVCFFCLRNVNWFCFYAVVHKNMTKTMSQSVVFVWL